ncbi:uncharacterized protein LOC130552839 [Triplophysa rosa]|nr:uncharacterized protein LOC130552839 [Triplophysa rosa]
MSLQTVHAPAGGNVTIHCLHILAHGNIKYFCRETCDGKNTLIISERGRNPTHRDRYSLYDEGSDFTVTITDLSSSDSGSYICAVHRLFIDTYGYVKLHVTEASTLIPFPTTTTRQPARRSARTTTVIRRTSLEIRESIPVTTESVTARRAAVSDLWVYVGCALGTLVLIFIIIFLVFIKHKSKQKMCPTSSALHHPDVLSYTTLNFTSRSDSLMYSTVLFRKEHHKNTERKCSRDPNERTSTLYSSVQTTGIK